MGLLDFVKENHAIGIPADLFGQLTALVVADVTGRGSHQPGYAEPLHVFGHVDPNHVRFLLIKVGRERLGEFGFADPGRAEEDEASHRALRILQATSSAADGSGDRADGVRLTDDSLMKVILHSEQFLGFRFHELGDRDSGPGLDDHRDLVLAHHGFRLLCARPFFLAVGDARFELLALRLEFSEALVIAVLSHEVVDLGLELVELHLVLAHLERGQALLEPDAARRFVDQVDRLIGQAAVADVAVAELDRGNERIVGDFHVVVRFVSLAQALQDVDRLLLAGLADLDGLEPALEGGVALDVFAEFVLGRGAYTLQFATRQSRLHDVGGVDRAFGGSRAHQRMKFVDEEDDLSLGPAHFLHHLLHSLFEFAAIFRAGDKTSKVQCHDSLVLQEVGDVAAHDPQRQAFGDCGLPDARIADQTGVVFGSARQYLHDAFDFRLPSDDRIELPFSGQLGQVATEFIERLRLRAAAATAGSAAAARFGLGLVVL